MAPAKNEKGGIFDSAKDERADVVQPIREGQEAPADAQVVQQAPQDAPPEQVATLVMSAPSATSPVKAEEALGAFAADFERRPSDWVAASVPESLPSSVRNSKELSQFNQSANDNLSSVVLRPGHIFTAAGRYHDVTNVENKFDVEAGQKIPDGLFLVSERYLKSAYDRGLAE